MTDPLKILVIDDSEDDRLLYRRALQKSVNANYIITEASDGEEGLKRIQEDPPACILLDYSMPGRDGVEVLKRIRAKHPFIPVVMLTGQGNEAVAVTAIQEGAQNYIAKTTITPEAIQRVIRVAIEHCIMQKRIYEQRTSLEIFTRALAHDLKEPVRTIRSFLDLIQHDEPLSEKGKSYFTYIQNAAERMNTLIETVYFYTRLDGDGQIAREICDVGKVLEEAKENIVQLIRERKAEITCDPLPEVSANKMQVLQVLQNLLCNAIRHCEDVPHIHVRAEEGTTQWLLRVSDNGPGIAPEHSSKIFQPFKRVAHHKEQGLGLGLAICKKIVESHGGKIWYESNPDAGATFLFTLPKASAAPPASTLLAPKAQTWAKAGSNLPLANLLLVDDNEADIELSRIMLVEHAHLQCNLLSAHDAEEALDRLQSSKRDGNPVDLMLLDINMPGMDGFELLEEIRKVDALKDIPVVMCTTSSYDKDMERAKALGVAGYMTKPAEFGKLKAIIEEATGLTLRKEGELQALIKAA